MGALLIMCKYLILLFFLYLQAWFSLNSPKVHHGPPNPSIQLKEYEAALERERAKNKMLVKQIDETKKELRHYKNESKSLNFLLINYCYQKNLNLFKYENMTSKKTSKG